MPSQFKEWHKGFWRCICVKSCYIVKTKTQDRRVVYIIYCISLKNSVPESRSALKYYKFNQKTLTPPSLPPQCMSII